MVNISNLIKYYTECIEIESLEELSVPSFKEDESFIRFPENNEWSAEEDANISVVLPQGVRRQLALGRATSSIYYGWPIQVKTAKTKNGNPYLWIEPIFTLKVEIDEDGTNHHLSLVKEWPQMNARVLSKITNSIEERVQLLESLGLAEAESVSGNGLKEYWDKFVELYPDLNLRDNFQDQTLSTTDYDEFQEDGIYNQGVLMVASAPRYNRGLLRELRMFLKDNHIENIGKTSLNALLNPGEMEVSEQVPNSQVSLLNRSQRQACSNTFQNNLSVITGPPGTGKSQVVLNIMVNAFENNQSVLFTSKNNKAVDVVCERMLESVNFPINLRLGSRTAERDYTIEFLDLLDKVLSGGDKDAITTKYETAQSQYEEVKGKYFNTLEQLGNITKYRNRINELDRDHEEYEEVLGNEFIEKLQGLGNFNLNLFADFRKEIERVKSNENTLIHSLVGIFSNKFTFGKLHDLCHELNGKLGKPFKVPNEVKDKRMPYAAYFKKVEKWGEYLKIYKEIEQLRGKLNKSDINLLTEQIEKLEVTFVEKCQKYIEALGRYRMINLSSQERQDLTNYHSIIRQLSGAYPGNRAYAKLKEQQENTFRRISSILPIWSVTNLSAGGNFPFGAGIFDIVIVDEASQSDIASAIPLLYRAKKAVVIGDPQQLTHISSVGKSQDNMLMQRYELLDEDGLRFSYSAQSLYHCARGAVGSENVAVLNEHYRSHFSIIEFSNREWYDGNLEIRTNYDNLVFPPEDKDFIEWINVEGQTTSPGSSAVNHGEADRVLEILDDIFNLYETRKVSVGIVTPFRAQVGYLKGRLAQKYEEDFIRDHFLISETAHKFQGDERDIVIFSPVISSGANQSAVRFLQKTSNLFNVAITRARSILWVVGNKNFSINAGIPYLKNFVEYIEHKKYNNIDLPYDGFQSPWEKKLYEALVTEGFNPSIQHPAGPYFIDIALIKGKYKLAIEVDGDRWHTTLTGERLERDLVKDRNLKRMDWDVLRFWVHDLKYDLEMCLKKVVNKLSAKESEDR